MTQLKVLVLLILLMSLKLYSYGQTKKPVQQFQKYYQQLKSLKIDTFMIIKSGCIGCEVKYLDTLKSIVDGQTIYVLTKESGQFKLAIFDDIHKPIFYTADTCSLFDAIDRNKSILKQKDTFYKKELTELKKSKFFPPRPIHYSYKDLSIQTQNFKYHFIVTSENADYLGIVRENEKWFQVTKNIIELFYKYLLAFKD